MRNCYSFFCIEKEKHLNIRSIYTRTAKIKSRCVHHLLLNTNTNRSNKFVRFDETNETKIRYYAFRFIKSNYNGISSIDYIVL